MTKQQTKRGRKQKTPGEPLKTRAMRWTDAGWADVLGLGLDCVRALVMRAAASKRRATKRESLLLTNNTDGSCPHE
jgi:hypothetical protein